MVLQPIRFFKADNVTIAAGGLLHPLLTIASNMLLRHSKSLQHYLSKQACACSAHTFHVVWCPTLPGLSSLYRVQSDGAIAFFCKNNVFYMLFGLPPFKKTIIRVISH
jgi:hypothetical protein